MARIPSTSREVVIRLVYDGPPFSGKTTSVRALAGGMARSVLSLADDAGRTEYFDWLEYVGGSFEGIPIRCQILSVPGQAELSARRRALLADADAVVFVLNSTPHQLPAATAHLRELGGFLASRPAPRPGVIVQANYRDQPDALPVPALRSALGGEGLTLVESIATENQGIREAFVLAVRLALDRVRGLQDLGTLDVGAGAPDSPDALLAHLRALTSESPEAPEISEAHDTEDTEDAEDAEDPAGFPVAPAAAPGSRPPSQAPWLPDSSAPIGRVWPPVDGRMVLHSAASPGAEPRLMKDGSWRLRAADWHFYSAPWHELEHLDDGREVLLAWAHHHAGGLQRLSAQRCLALADTGRGTWRLWQVVRAVESLRQRLRSALRDSGPAGLARSLPSALALLVAARDSFSSGPQLPWGLDLIGENDGRPIYIGLLPPPDWVSPAESPAAAGPEALARREIQALIETARGEAGWDAEEFSTALRRMNLEELAEDTPLLEGIVQEPQD